jgi:hypothetical protein
VVGELVSQRSILRGRLNRTFSCGVASEKETKSEKVRYVPMCPEQSLAEFWERRPERIYIKLLQNELRCFFSTTGRFMRNVSMGKIWIEDDSIVYSLNRRKIWQLPLAEIIIIGEYTNQSGPTGNDYFIVFVPKGNPRWYEVPFNAEGGEYVLKQLDSLYCAEIRPSLHNWTDFQSQILWPEHLKGEILFEFIKEGLLGKLGLTNKQSLSRSVMEYIAKLTG